MSSVSDSRSSSISQHPYPYFQDAVRIYVQMGTPSEECFKSPGKEEKDPMTTSTSSIGPTGRSRRFSVDPQLTSFEILKNLVERAFDMKGDFAISYRAFDDFGGEAYLPLVSDWDLSAAFLSASDPDLQLIIEPKNIPLDVDEDEPWDIIKSTEVINDASQKSSGTSSLSSSFQSSYNSQNRNYQRAPNQNLGRLGSFKGNNNGNNNFNFSGGMMSGSKVLSTMSQISGAYPISLNSKINTAGIFNTMEKWVQKAKTFVEDISVVTTRPPLSDIEFRNYLDPGGVLCRPRELRYACYHGGIEAGLRKVVWKHLLNIYPDGLSGNARIDYVRNKAKEYYELRDTWMCVKNGQVSEDILCVSNMVKKDVLRTDRLLPFYAGPDDNQNVGFLFNILTTYALNHPSVGYCQGMSDLASPLLFTMGDEAQAYVCFCALMDRIKPNFNLDGMAMQLKFSHLAEAVAFYDPDFWGYLKSISADDLLFCYRWLLLELKREFAFEDALRMLEVLWASAPYKPQDVSLFEVKFTISNVNPIPIPVPTFTSSYSRVCALRRSSTSIGAKELRGRRLSRKPKVNPHSLDENFLSSMSSNSTISSYRSHARPFYSLDETSELFTSGSSDFTASPFETFSFIPNKNSIEDQETVKPRMVKNLREFWTIGKKDSDDSPDSHSFSSKSSTVSNSESAVQQCAPPDGDSNSQVFFDDLEDSCLTMSTHSLGKNDLATQSLGRNNNFRPSRSRHDSTHSEKIAKAKLMANFLKDTNTTKEINLKENQQSDIPTTGKDNNSSETFQPLGEKITQLDHEGISQFSEHDSGHCFGDSCEIQEFENSLQEPEFLNSCSSGIGSGSSIGRLIRLPPPDIFGGGNPFLMFLSLTLLLQHRDHIMKNGMDYNETAMYFDKMIRKHNLNRVLAHARMLFSEYLKQHVTRA